MMFNIIFLTCVLLILVFRNTDAAMTNQCRLFDGKAGSCILIKECLPLYELSIYKKKTEDHILYLKQAVCGVSSKFIPKVCCPHESDWLYFDPPAPIEFPKPNNSVKESETNIRQLDRTAKTIEAGKLAPPADLEEFRKEFFKDNGECPQSLTPPKLLQHCCGLKSKRDGRLRIVGGVDSPVNDHPWLALLEYSHSGLQCAGSLISSRYVLTAAHCVTKESRTGPVKKVRLSEYDVSTYPYDIMRTPSGKQEYVTVLIITVERQIRHPEYLQTPSRAVNDIGLVKLSRNAPYSYSIRPICLPFVDPSNLTNRENQEFSAVGWGKNGHGFNEVRKVVNIKYVNFDRCQKKHGNTLLDTQFCAGAEEGKDTCQGDSGGPLIITISGLQSLSGIVSYGLIKCGTEGAPAVYTNVFKYLDWIKKEII